MSTEIINRNRLSGMIAETYDEMCEMRGWPSMPTPEAQEAERRGMAEIAASRVDTMPLLVISRLDAENARLQRVVDDLADALRQANAEVWAMAHGYDFPEGGKQVSSAGVKKRAIAIGRRISASLIKHVLLRPCDDPAQVPSAMRAEVTE